MKKLFLKLLGYKTSKPAFDMTKVKSVLLRPSNNAIGDTVLLTPLLRNLKTQLPKIKLALILPSGSADVLKNNPYIDKIYKFKNRKSLSTLLLGLKLRWQYDVYIEMGTTINSDLMFFATLLNAPVTVSAEKEPKKGLTEQDLPLYNKIVKLPKQAHPIQQNLSYLSVFNLIAKDDSTEIFLEDSLKNKYSGIFKKDTVNIIFNYTGAVRAFTEEESKSILKHLAKHKNTEILCLIPPHRKENAAAICAAVNNSSVKLAPETKTVLEAAALIKECDILISVDTAPVHIACAFDKKIISVQSNYKNVIPAYGRYVSNIRPPQTSKDNNDLSGFDLEEVFSAADFYIDLTKKEKGISNL